MMNANTITAAIAALTQAVEALTTIIGELTTTETTTEAATTETTTETTTATTAPAETATTETTTEATTTATEIKNQISVTELDKIANDPTAIVVIDDDDKVIAVGSSLTSAETTETATTAPAETATTETTTGDLPCPPAVTETTVNGITTSRKAVVATTDDLVNIYEIIKYILQHEGVNSGIDKSVYAPTRNMYVTFNNGKYRMHLSMYDTEMMIALTKRCENDENIIMKIMINLSSIEVTSVDEEIEIAGNNARINTAINTIASTIELIK